ncbi:MAG: hypothetical protein ACKVS6_13255 [Planctomycetota bacterium]
MLRLITNRGEGCARAQRASVRGLGRYLSPSAAVVQARLCLLILRRHGYAREHVQPSPRSRPEPC